MFWVSYNPIKVTKQFFEILLKIIGLTYFVTVKVTIKCFVGVENEMMSLYQNIND